MGGSRGGVSGVATPPNGQSHSKKYSTTDVLSHAEALIYQVLTYVVVKTSCGVARGFALVGVPATRVLCSSRQLKWVWS